MCTFCLICGSIENFFFFAGCVKSFAPTDKTKIPKEKIECEDKEKVVIVVEVRNLLWVFIDESPCGQSYKRKQEYDGVLSANQKMHNLTWR